MDSRHEDAQRGVRLAQRAMLAVADGDDGAALAVLNEADTAEVRWAAAYLLGTVREALLTLHGGDESAAREALRAGATSDDDATASLEVIVDEWIGGGGDD